jgi:hemolysin activation/secretion protein
MKPFQGKSPHLRIAVTVLFFLLSDFAQAGAVIDRSAQEQFRQQERERLLHGKQESMPDVRLPDNAPVSVFITYPDNEFPCVIISKISLVGEAANLFRFALSEVNQGSNTAIGHCLGTQGINLAMSRVQNAIITKGYVTTRILAAPQDLNSGELQLTVVPGRVNQIQFAEGVTPRATKWNAVPIRNGDILNLRDIEQGLENLKRAATAEADIQIAPVEDVNAKPGASDILIDYRQRFPLRITLSADDAGFDSTGKYQGGVTISGDNLLMLNDLFYVNYNHDLGGGEHGKQGSEGHTMHYSLPIGYWLFGFTTSSYDYHQAVAGLNQSYIYSGHSQNSDIKASRLVYRNAINKTYLSLRGFFKKSSNFIDDTEIEVQRRRTAGWEVGFSQNWFLGQSMLDYQLAYRRGTGAMNALKAPEEAFDEGSSRMEILTLDATFSLPYAVQAPWGQQNLQYVADIRMQSNFTPLTPQDRFAIGNRYTVRGFDGQLTLSADRGWFLRNDFSAWLGESGQAIYVGLDYGEVGGQSSDLLLGKQLAGGVIGMRGGYRNLSYDIFLGKALKKPWGFETASTAAGFNMNLSF